MAEEEEEEVAGANHVVLLPGPMQGNVNSMMKLAQLLALHHFHVTFLTTDFIHRRLRRFADIQALSQTYPNLEFRTISDGLPDDHPRSDNHALADLYSFLNSHAKPLLRDILLSQSAAKPKVTCLIGDGFLGGLTADVADEVGIPLLHFRAMSASCFWALFCAPTLFESNQLPIRGIKL